ncbi:MAG: flagellar hook-length control protein FliK, partial [Arthrobacter pascens]|nr:flagellar hook-length control protein FliK [Arthrobacter pascens]
AAPAGAAAATKAGTATGAEGFGDALSTVLAGLDPAGTAPTGTAPAQQPFDADPAASAQDAGSAAPQLGPADPAQSPPAIFQLPVTPAAAVALQASEAAPEAGQNATTPAPDGELPALQAADPLAGAAVADSAGVGAAEATTGAQQPAQPPAVSADSTPGQGTAGAAGRATEPGMPSPETRMAPLTAAQQTPAPLAAPAGTAAPAAAVVTSAPAPAPDTVPEPRSAANAAAVPAGIGPSTAVHTGRADGYQLGAAPAAAAAENTPLYAPLAPPAAAAAAVPAGTPTAAVPVPVPQNFSAQLVRPVFTLASAGVGEHTMTVAVNPENLGPVTVQAHISSAGIRVELFAANADGRDVLRQILPELKRDLAAAGMNASLDLSSGNQPEGRQPDGGPGGREPFTTRGRAFAYPDGTDSRQLPVNEPTSRAGSLYGADGSLDVMA